MRTSTSFENRPIGYRLFWHGFISDARKRTMDRLPALVEVGVCIQNNTHDITFLGRFELNRNGLK